MKKLYLLKCIFILIVYSFCLITVSKANWKRAEEKLSTQHTQHTQHTKSDSLPKGVTKDWLGDIRDENGNRIANTENSRAPVEDPDGDALQRKIFNGLTAGSQFGYSVSSAGDVNGDGFDDVIIGAYSYNSNTGRAYIYYGGINMNTIADVILTGTATNNFLGCSVSCSGDINGDGYDDVIVGAYGYTSNTGRAYIYFGGASMNNTVDVTMTGDSANNYFGISVSSPGDVNGDGYSDVIIGATGYGTFTGKGYIYFGGATMNNTVDVTMTGETVNDAFGYSVSSAGDVNADGYSDVIIGAKGYSSNTGSAYIYFGGNSMNNIADVLMTGEAVNNNFGISVSSAGDINGDGYSDVITGAFGFNSNFGKAYVFYGGASMNSVADVTMTGEAMFNYFGNSVSKAGDINGDGFSDVIIGANGSNSNTGSAYVYFGGTSMDTTADVRMKGESVNNNFGYSVASAGDLNGDGYSDLLIGAFGYSSNTGRAYFYNYFMKNEITSELVINGEATNHFFGNSVASAGDVNGDGYSDIIVGAYGYSSNTGRAYIYLGGITMDNVADITFTGEFASDYFGTSVSSGGDLNGDGYSDIIIGAIGYNSYTGRSYVFLGGMSMDNVADVVMTGESVNGSFGFSVSSAGDVNGDGYSDVIVGARTINSSTGKGYVYFGGSSMNNIFDVAMPGEGANNYFGGSVSSAGDVNGDGYSDVIVGAEGNNTYTGKANIYYGGIFMNNFPDVSLVGEVTYSLFGIAVSSGDVNADGYSDIIVGSSISKVYIFYGSSTMNITADVLLTSPSSLYFGEKVSSAGDVNQDGYSDVIVGDDSYNSVGGAFIYYGGAFMDNSSDIFMTGDTSTSLFGGSVSSAGDINGDGYSDIVVGAAGNVIKFGRSYLYTGSAISVKPILISAKDVPNDQGGFVDLKWARSSYDVNGNDIITNYLVERSLPPSGGDFAWVNIASISATKNSFYSHLASTPFDSSTNSYGTFFFRVTARTNSPSQYWRSAILSGRSLDNISPPLVSPFNAYSETDDVRLTWKRNTAPDLFNYVLFRSTSPSIDPYTETPLSALTDSTYLDTSPLTGVFYYFIVAQDIHNNYSPVAVVQSPVSSKNLFLFGAIQGMYDAVANTMIHDTVTVYLRSASSPFAKIDSSRKLLYGPGTGQEFFFANAQNNIPYYVEVKHRNALETWSADPVTFVSDAASIAFSVDEIYAYGNNQIQVDNDPYNVFAFYSGDVNQDGFIDLTDVLTIYNGANAFLTGYLVTDLTGDNAVDLTDVIMAYNNAVGFVGVERP